MHLSFRHSYPGTTAQVVDLFRNPDFITDVAQHAGAQDHDVSVADGITRLRMALPTPDNVSTFVGKTADISLVFKWDATTEQQWQGKVDVSVKGLPVSVDAKGFLQPSADGAVADYEGDLSVKIPLVGGKVEKMVAPFISEAFAGIERRAQEWLTR